jgi:LmbE family N-acetylglucosaminyl deacetylase
MARILIISPHGDDEVLGCGGLIAKATSNNSYVEIVYGATGGLHHHHLRAAASTAERTSEIAAACDILGVDSWSILYPGLDMQLDTVPQLELVTKLDAILDAGHFDEVYVPYPSHNSDHQVLHRAARAALRPGARESIELIAMYEYVYPGWCQVTDAGGRIYVDISDFIELKCRALMAYKSQIQSAPSPASTYGVRALAALRGLEACVDHAELYHLLQLLR